MSAEIVPPITLAQYRDILRRWCEITPPVDPPLSLGPTYVGAAPTGQPNPSNALLNQAVNAAIETVNSVLSVGPIYDTGPINIVAAPSYRLGPYWYNFAPNLRFPANPFEVTDAVWVSPATNAPTRLEPITYYRDDPAATPQFTQWQQFPQQPQPQNYIVIGTQIGLIPANNQGGILYLTGMHGMNQLLQDTESIDSLPSPYQNVITYIAMVFICARTLADTNYQARGQSFLPLATDGLTSLHNWKGGRNPEGLARTLDTLRMMTGARAQAQAQAAPQGGQ